MKRVYPLVTATLLCCASGNVLAGKGDIDFSLLSGAASGTTTQAQAEQLFQDIFEFAVADLSSAMSYKAVAPAEPLGITGIDVGLVITATKMANAKKWDEVVDGGSTISTLPTFKLAAQKGLPFGIDVGAFYMGTSSSNVKLVGGELRYAILEGGVATPALAVRGTFSKLSGVSDFSFSSQGLEVSVSKGFLMLTPYAGVGIVQYKGSYDKPISIPSTAIVVNLDEASDQQTKTFVGVNFNMGLFNIAVDGDKTGDSTSYSLKFGFRF